MVSIRPKLSRRPRHPAVSGGGGGGGGDTGGDKVVSQTMFMETTQISPETTVSQIQKLLMEKGASAILTEMENGNISAVSFKYKVGENHIPFCLPCRWKNIETLLVKRANLHAWSSADKKEVITLKAKRVAWRQILRWVESQLALVDTSMVKIEEVFFPYIQSASGETVYEIQEKKNFGLLIGNGK